jgi:hypothetical protein
MTLKIISNIELCHLTANDWRNNLKTIRSFLDCTKMVFLQFLSISVNVLCLVQKLPQIIRIYQTKNVDSISVSSVLLEETA